MDVRIAPHLPRFQGIVIEALSIRKSLDHESGIDQCQWKQMKAIEIPMSKADLGAIAEYPAHREHKLLAPAVPQCRSAVVVE